MRPIRFRISKKVIEDAVHFPKDIVLMHIAYDPISQEYIFYGWQPWVFAKFEIPAEVEVELVVNFQREEFTGSFKELESPH